ncbi:hypothetical protein V1477_011200 [Vespula maculifrons]|uniref:Uncharacterized protein n=1 Tax=Vespula maculifrons TaxID=7453 RepID=A0ABD2C440_VESMC
MHLSKKEFNTANSVTGISNRMTAKWRKKRRSPTVRYYCETWIRYDGGGESPFVFPLARSNIPTMVLEEKKMEEEEKEEESSNADESCNTFAARNIVERITKVAGRALVMV